VEVRGIPWSVYRDRHGTFQRNDDHWSVAEQLAGRQLPTQVGRALEELGIESIAARSPQAKGRVERLWKTFQDRLVSELRLARASGLERANAVLDLFLVDCPHWPTGGAMRAARRRFAGNPTVACRSIWNGDFCGCGRRRPTSLYGRSK